LKRRFSGRSGILVLLSMMVWAGCQDSMEKSVPLHLIGVWETSHPRYNDCLIEITAEQIIFQNPAIGININFIKGILTTPEGPKTLYDIHYQDREGGDFTLSVYYSRIRDQDMLQFKNQADLQWTRKGLS
jgi:hypothetical protein